MSVDALLNGKRVLIVAGAGGVGKTTCAATLALSAACRGKRVAVLTVDPARRLAQALGFSSFNEEEAQVRIPAPHDAKGGSLTALMLDVRRTYDRLVVRTIRNPEHAEAILANKFYRHFTEAVGGSHEYSAMERLYELVMEDRYDLVVLDTPPSAQALDFLDAPKRLSDAFDDSLFAWLAPASKEPGSFSPRGLGGAYILKTLKLFAGAQLVDELAAFLSLFRDMLTGFRTRAKAVEAFLGEETTGFIVVAAPHQAALTEAALFGRELHRMGYPLAAYLINRVITPLNLELNDEAYVALAPAGFPAPELLAHRLHEAQTLYQAQAAHDHARLGRILQSEEAQIPLVLAPLRAQDPTNLDALLSLAAAFTQETRAC